MTRDEIQLLYEYDRWANNRVLQAASALSAEEFTRDLGGGRVLALLALHHLGQRIQVLAQGPLVDVLQAAAVRLGHQAAGYAPDAVAACQTIHRQGVERAGRAGQTKQRRVVAWGIDARLHS